MKTMRNFLIAGLSAVFLISACTVEKRMHTSGYHIDWYNSKSKKKDTEVAEKPSKRMNKFSSTSSSESERATPSLDSKKATQGSFYTDFTVPELTVANPDANQPSDEENNTEIAASEDDAMAEVISDRSAQSLMENSQDYIASIDESSSGKNLHIPSLVGFLVTLLGLIPGLGFMSTIGLAICVVSLFLLKGNKDKYKGKGFAIVPVALAGLGFLISAILFIGVSSLFGSFGQGVLIAFGLICLIFAALTAWLLYAYFEQW